MKLYTYASPSHRAMAERFVVATGQAAGFSGCHMFSDEQFCPTANYNSPGFARQMWQKLHCLAQIPIGERALYVDADCLLRPGLAQWCSDWLDSHQESIGHGDDVCELCMGTLLFIQTEKTVRWWQFLNQLAWITGLHDQAALKGVMENAQQLPVKLEVLPKEVFANWAVGGDHSQKIWKGEELHIPQETLCWHANFCIGVDTKVKMLETVENLLTNFVNCG